ncbi:ComEC/Rec2 family competence protein [Adhaeribacter swui]|uniref:ComEC/Rec2 family competence protein n=1 Tax=Adhaeribacter swui TaxID=2086471 RepID=A0A7G7GAT4_9BACT|nr:ComEC/Rec2 family competence protein [Adhaeribacter swui]QNF34268.1 ComEC/Rec2 family competence protein [Adhaeribacter swui]
MRHRPLSNGIPAMIKWAPFIFIRIAVCFCAGILWQIYSSYPIAPLLVLIAVFSILFLIFHLVGTQKAANLFIYLAGFSGLVSIFLLGNLITYQRTETNQPNHLAHVKQPIVYYTGVISDFVVEKPKHYNVILRVSQVRTQQKWQPVTGKVMLMLRKEPGMKKPGYGDVLLFKGQPLLPNAPLNPNAFNYKEYLAHQQIYHQQYVWPGQYKVINYAPPSRVMAGSIWFRNYLNSVLKEFVPGARNYAIATALVLGMKEYLDTDIKAAYTRTGTTHVLAVSGLHVALLFFALNTILGKLAKTRQQKLLVFLLLLVVMWLYGFVTALSPSVLRAVVMFTLLSVGKQIKRRRNMYNILAATAFGLLVFNPFFLLDVGFQLSFAAVLGIVLWQPRLSKLINFKNWLGRKLWEGVTASVAAQLATMPLALYYFHQFPVYFLVANLFAIIISEFILYVGFILLAVAWVPRLGEWLGWIMGVLLDAMNSVVLLMQSWPMAIIESINLSMMQAWLLAAAFLFTTWFLLYRHKLLLAVASGAIVVFSGLQFVKQQEQRQQKLWVVYNLKNASGLGFIQGQQAYLLTDSTLVKNAPDFTYNIQPHWGKLGITEVQFTPFKNVSNLAIPTFTTPAGNIGVVWHGVRILILKNPEQFSSVLASPVSFDYILLQHNVRIEPATLQANFKFKALILDSSNKPWYRKQIAQLCNRQQISVYDVSKRGAFVYQSGK